MVIDTVMLVYLCPRSPLPRSEAAGGDTDHNTTEGWTSEQRPDECFVSACTLKTPLIQRTALGIAARTKIKRSDNDNEHSHTPSHTSLGRRPTDHHAIKHCLE